MTTTLSFPENGNEGVGVTGAAGVDGVNAGRAVEGSGARQRQREDRSKDAADVARSGILKRQAATPFGQDAKVASSSGAMAVRSFSALAATSSTASWPLTQTSLTSVASATPGLPEPSGNSEPSAPIALPPHLAAASASNHLTRTHTHNPALSVASSTATTTTTVTTTPTPTPSLLLASRRAPSLASSSSHFKGEINKLVKVHDKSGAKSINQYAVLREIGRGVHGKVKVAQDSTDGSLWVSLTMSLSVPVRRHTRESCTCACA
ncbi:hypothetical protein BC830DRAFT_1100509 [Chytriomyces sp. MP71]|nr:hypothetical protein BC830DRAFT_1100509 [Chytriomyces sp. MP71]